LRVSKLIYYLHLAQWPFHKITDTAENPIEKLCLTTLCSINL
jgi:hypothetical protein